jgi:arylformamidase
MDTARVLGFSSLKGALTAGILEKAFRNTEVSENTSILFLKTDDSSRKQKGAGVINYQNEGFGEENLDPLYLDKNADFWVVEKSSKPLE